VNVGKLASVLLNRLDSDGAVEKDFEALNVLDYSPYDLFQCSKDLPFVLSLPSSSSSVDCLLFVIALCSRRGVERTFIVSTCNQINHNSRLSTLSTPLSTVESRRSLNALVQTH
jgi:hypothetical protein